MKKDMDVVVAVAVAVSGGGAVAVAVAVAGLTKRFFNHIQKDFLIKISCLFHSLSFWSAHRCAVPMAQCAMRRCASRHGALQSCSVIFSRSNYNNETTDDGRTDGVVIITKRTDGRTKRNWGQGTGARHGRCGGKARVINGDSWGAKPPRPPPGGKARVTEIPGGAKPPQTPPRHHFKKFALQGQIF